MKTKLKIFNFIALFTLFNFFYSCQDDEILIESDKKSFELKTSKISIKQVINEISTQSIKQKLQNKNFDSSISNTLHRTSDSEVYFIKKEKNDELTSYILHLNSYSQSEPYFLKLIITKNNNETERMGYIKYIPTYPVANLDLKTFTGSIQILDMEEEVTALTAFSNGNPVASEINLNSRLTCYDQISIAAVNCGDTGNHPPGVACDNGTYNSYWSISVTTVCKDRGDQLVQIIEDTGNGNNDGASSVAVGEALAHNFSLTLTPEQQIIYGQNPSIAEYLSNNVIVVPNPNYNPSIGGNPTIIIIDPQAEEFATELMDLAILETNQEDANKIISLSIMFETSENIFTEEFGQSVLQFTDINPSHIPPDYPLANLSITTFLKYKQLRQLNPDWSRSKCIWYATKEMIHVGLDVFGMVPLIGEPADILNGVLYTIEGDGLNATLSYSGAVPLAGWAATSTKFAIKINEVATIGTKIKLVWKISSNGVIQFGSRNQLRKALGMAASSIDPRQAHHLIPWSSQSKMAVQRAAKYGSAFHMNEALNGIEVAAWRNQPNHNTYNNIIDGKLDAFRNLNPNATPQECYEFVTNLIHDIRTWVINNPNSHLNDITLP
jgi:hypothetical protein